MGTETKKRGAPKKENAASEFIKIRVTPEFKALVTLIKTEMDTSEASVIIEAVTRLSKEFKIQA